MGKVEILAALSELKAEDRQQVLQRLCELQEQDLLHGGGPSEEEVKLLDKTLADYERDRDPGTPWREAIGRIRASRKQ